MKMNLNEYSDVEVISTTEQKRLTLSEDSSAIIFQMFSKNIYSNPIGSVVREITSNCFDSHVEAGVNLPVLIKKSHDDQTDTTYISFIDFGVGMSPDRINNVFSVYFSSTKRGDNSQIGGFGLGSKSVLAYKRSTGHGAGEYDNSYNIITNYNGVQYTYLIYEGKESPYITLISYDYTTEGNGTEVRIPVLNKDIPTFEKEIIRQLYYFENLVFEGFSNKITNDYQIVRGNTFYFRGNEYDSNVHVCLGRVAYPIDYDVLGLNKNDYLLPIALKLEVGEIGVTASRETLDYSETTIKILKNKLNAARQEIIDLLVKQYKDVVELEDYFKVKYKFGHLYFSNGTSMYIGNILEFKNVNFSNYKYSFMKMPNDKQLFQFFFNYKNYGKKEGKYNRKNSFDGGYTELTERKNLLYVENTFNRKVIKQAYLKEKFETYYIISKRPLTNFEMRGEIADLFNVHIDKFTDEYGLPIKFIQTLLDMQDEFLNIVKKYATDYDNLEIPEDFVAARNRKAVGREMRKNIIPVKLISNYDSRVKMRLDVLFDFECPIFYGTNEDESKLSDAYAIFRLLFDSNCVINSYYDYNHSLYRNDKKGIMFIQISQQNVRYMQYCKKAYHINEFYWRMLYRKADMVTKYFQSYGIIGKFNDLPTLYKHKCFVNIDKTWGDKINDVRNYITNIVRSSKDQEKIGNNSHLLLKYFDVSNAKMTAEQTRLLNYLDELQALVTKNEKSLQYISMPYYLDKIEPELIEILKKVLSL